MGLVKYTRYPEERGRGIKTMQQGVDYSGVVQLEWPDFPVFQRQVAGFLSTTLSDHKLKADHHILNPNWLPANPLQSMGVLRCFSQKHNFKWFIAVREKTGKENEKMHAHVLPLHQNLPSIVISEVSEVMFGNAENPLQLVQLSSSTGEPQTSEANSKALSCKPCPIC